MYEGIDYGENELEYPYPQADFHNTKKYKKIDIINHIDTKKYEYEIQFMKINDAFFFNFTDFGSHASFYLRVSDREYLYDPSGDFVPLGEREHFDIIDLNTTSLGEYYDYHAGVDEGSLSIDILETELTKGEAEIIEQQFNSGSFPAYGSIHCAQHVGNVISDVSRFGSEFNYEGVTFPSTLFYDLEKLDIKWNRYNLKLKPVKKNNKNVF